MTKNDVLQGRGMKEGGDSMKQAWRVRSARGSQGSVVVGLNHSCRKYRDEAWTGSWTRFWREGNGEKTPL